MFNKKLVSKRRVRNKDKFLNITIALFLRLKKLQIKM